MLEILEHYGIDVVYDFDRTHENIEDCYWAAAKANGFQFRFDENQSLDVIFLYLVEREGFTPISRKEIDVPVFETFDEAEKECNSKNIPFIKSPGEPGTRDYKWWIKPSYGDYTVHYQYKDGAIRMITISTVKNA